MGLKKKLLQKIIFIKIKTHHNIIVIGEFLLFARMLSLTIVIYERHYH